MMREEWEIDICNQLEEETHGEVDQHGGGTRFGPSGSWRLVQHASSGSDL